MKNIDIKKIETKYTIFKDGKIINTKSGRVIKGSLTNCGYKRVTFFGKRVSLHRVIAFKFLPIIDEKKYVNHKNGDKLDNRVENLEWCTMSENSKHAFSIGLKQATIAPRYGEENTNSILTDKLVIDMLTYKDLSYREIAEKFNVSKSTVKHIFRGRSWTHIERPIINKVNSRIQMNLSEAKSIRKRLSNGARQCDIAREYNVDKSVISKIARNITWKEKTI